MDGRQGGASHGRLRRIPKAAVHDAKDRFSPVYAAKSHCNTRKLQCVWAAVACIMRVSSRGASNQPPPTWRLARLRLSSRCTARASCGLAAASALNLQPAHTQDTSKHQLFDPTTISNTSKHQLFRDQSGLSTLPHPPTFSHLLLFGTETDHIHGSLLVWAARPPPSPSRLPAALAALEVVDAADLPVIKDVLHDQHINGPVLEQTRGATTSLQAHTRHPQ